MKVDSINIKLKQTFLAILISTITIVILKITILIIGNTYMVKLVNEELIPYLIGAGVIFSGIFAGSRIKETLQGKILYGILTATLSVVPVILAIILTSPLVGGL